MLKTRVFPCLLLHGTGLVKGERFINHRYVGDPLNAVRIFNEKEVGELLLLDITATRQGNPPAVSTIAQISDECFMPLTAGGGVACLEDIHDLLAAGAEKVAINSAAVENPGLITDAANRFGSQSVVIAIDARRRRRGYEVYTHGGRRAAGLDPATHSRRMAEAGCGEILITSIDRDGTMSGYDLELVTQVAAAVNLPVVAAGGAGCLADLAAVTREGRASAATAGSLFVFHGPRRAVLINFPTPVELSKALNAEEGSCIETTRSGS